ncbi:flagellar export chaperone FlgN [Thiomicrospira sp. R3]|uniref:flagellar export chaperone FlgN n=1 Tax=Thiomicrospira sp. R3 TaxID=3035472 RepID=UPI00259B7C07|nr:flagellar export chaperone FlgN [Thiomicrospira sp. R3]WFE67881.1 flagellar export chaperone FlgN [Thiomicrospira sp. R3]
MPVSHLNKLSLQLEQLGTGLTEFKDLLVQETSFLSNNDISSLNQITLKKQSLADNLEDQITTIQQIYPINFADLDNPELDNLPPEQRFQINKIANLSNQCFHLNRKNGMIIAALTSLNTELLNQLSPEESKVNLYGASGKTKKPDTKKTLGTA